MIYSFYAIKAIGVILKDQVIVTILSKIDEKLASIQIYPGTICSNFSFVLLHFEHWVQANR